MKTSRSVYANSDKKMQYLTVLAAATTLLAGILHLMMVGTFFKPPNFPLELLAGSNILFIVSGVAQILLAVPMFLRWNIRWYYAGLVGTAGLVILLAASRIPNPMTGQALQNNSIGTLTEIVQIAYIVITAIIIVKQKRIMNSIPEKKH